MQVMAQLAVRAFGLKLREARPPAPRDGSKVPWVLVEVREVAEDIRRDLAKLREEGIDGLGGTKAVSPEAVESERKDA